ncbi:RHS repeat-associated core domain-containing protein, partial [Chryseobacterium ginsengisoli]|uniref:RHS repeat-associated core domain-containing protein n=1 Tax=Chryseobacterium ginsengisoli TaxID=363853 RepID=UPI0031F022D1
SFFNNGSSAEVLEENNYYPFGLKHEGYNPTVGNPAYTYSYNGKELQTESGMYDYGARMYMPDLGRWGVVDPLAEKSRRFTPYNYAVNNPIRFIDPDGRQNEDWIKKDNTWTYDPNITTASQAAAAGADDFAKNGTIVSYGEDGEYARLSSGGSVDWLPNTSFQDVLTNNLALLSQSFSQGIDSFSSLVSSQVSGGWNSMYARNIISDSYNVGLTSNVTVFLGVGTTPINFTLLTRGQEPGIYFTPTVNAAIGDGVEGNVGVSFGRAMYSGDPREINSSMLQGNTYGVSGGAGLIVDGSVGVSYAPTGKGNGFWGISGQIGLGMEGSPVSVINVQGNYQYTPIVKPVIKFK